MCGQGRGRTADLPLFRDEENRRSGNVLALSCSLRAASVLDDDVLRQPCGVAVSRQVGQRRCYLSVAAVDCMQVAIGRSGRRMAEPQHEIGQSCACRGGQGLPGVAKVVKPEAGHIGLAPGAGERLPNSVTAHGLAVTPDEHAVRPRPFGHVRGEHGQDVRRDIDGSLTSVGLGRGVERLTGFEQLDAILPDRDSSCAQVDVSGVSAMISPRRSPHHAPSRTAARYRGVMAPMSAATWATEAIGRSLARSVPAPSMLAGLAGIAPSRTAVASTA
jgi:hypothetical protein